MPERSEVVIVDPDGRVIDVMPKLAAHEAPGRLHLAFSVFLFDTFGRTLIQQRAASKYHFGGIWANACCSHPLPGEDLASSAERRVFEELGVTTSLSEVGKFIYRAVDPVSGRVEHELDHVLVGSLSDDEVLQPAPDEVDALEWVDASALHGAVADGPTVEGVGAVPDGNYAPWLVTALEIALHARGAGGPGEGLGGLSGSRGLSGSSGPSGPDVPRRGA